MTYHNQVLVLIGTVFFSKLCFSCAVCGAGQEGSSFSFILSTAILSFIPLLMFAVIYYVLKYLKNSFK